VRKFIIAAMVASLVFLTSFSPPAPASSLHNAVFTVGQSKYVVDGQAQQMDAAAFLQQPQDRVFVPVRYLAYSLGLTDSGITWDQTSQMAILTLGNTTVVLSPKEKTYYLNGQANQMDTLPLIKSGRLYLPARYVAQAFGYSVSWDQSTDSVVIGPASSTGTQSSAPADYNVQIVPLPSSAQAGQAVQLDISVTGTNNLAASSVTLVLTSNSSTATLSPAEVVTNASGQGVVTATDTAAETVTFTATVLNSNTTATASVQWTQSSTQTGDFTVHLSSSTTSATEGQPVVFTATVDSSAGSPVSGAGVTVASSSANALLSATSLVTNAQGQAFFTATDNSAENVTFTATPTGGGSAQTTSVIWSAPPSTPTYTSYATTPSLAISSTATAAALGQPVEYTVTATGNYGVAAGTALAVTSSSANAQLSTTTLTTNNAGQAFFTATDNIAETATFTVRMSSESAVMTSATTQWLASYTQTSSQSGNYYLDMSATTRSPVESQPVVFTVTVGNNAGSPVSDTGVSITSSSANAVLSATSLVTNAQGQAFFTATDNTAETVTFTATPTAGGSAQTTSVTWSVPPDTSTTYTINNFSELQISSTATTAALGQPVVYTVTTVSGYTLPSGSTLLVTSGSTNAQLSNTILIANSAGEAFFTATDNTAETVTFTVKLASSTGVMAVSTTQWLTSYAQSSDLLNNAPIYQLSISSSSGTAAEGQPVVLTLMVLDNNSQLASGIGISLISSSGNARLSSTYVTTNSQGRAYVTVTDNAAENVTFTASMANVTSRTPYVTTTVQWSYQTNASTGYSNSRVTVSGYYAALSESAESMSTGQPAVLTVTVTNSSNQPVSGLNVLLSSGSANVQLTGTNSVTNSQGQVFFTAVDNTTENVTFSVQLETNGTYSTPVAAGTLQWYN